MKWAIVYDDLSVVRGEGELEWRLAPPDGVQWVVNEERLMGETDYYYYHDGAFYHSDDLGPLLRKLGVVKFGRMANTKVWDKTREIAVEIGKEYSRV